ncbi:Matrilin-4 [Cladorrhinum sp. PSN259]|nr:Matrilin-4 [Cladorrhinum sp. PSN259]
MTVSIPVASVGANPSIAKELQAYLLPEYSIVHICLDLAAATAELPLLFSGDRDVSPSSGLGTNDELSPAERQIPRAIIFGGKTSEEEVQTITQAVHAKAPGIKTVHVTKQDIVEAGGNGPNPEIISSVLKKKLVELGDLSGPDA